MSRLCVMWPLLGLALVSGTASGATTFSGGAGQAGSRGTPYGWLGPQRTRAWEEYRKAANPGAFPFVFDTTEVDPGMIR